MLAMIAAEIWSTIEEETACCLSVENDFNRADSSLGKQFGWVVQLDAWCFDDITISLGCIMKDPTANIFLAATKRIESVTDPSSSELMLSVGPFKLWKD